MSKINFPKKQEQRLIPKYLLDYAEELQENHPDPSAEWGSSGGDTIQAGTGITITTESDDTKTISVDTETVALKTDIPTNYVTTNTDQTITGAKTFQTNLASTYRTVITPSGDIRIHHVSEEGQVWPDTDYPTTELEAGELWLQFEGKQAEYNCNSIIYYSDISDPLSYKTYSLVATDSDRIATLTDIPDAVSGTNDGTNWTSLTIGEDTYGLASGGSTYTAGTGIDITGSTISVDTSVIAEVSDIPTDLSDLNNDVGYITGIDSTDVTTALGYTPYNSTNPNGYITSADLPTNHVTTDTNQTITGQKTFQGSQLVRFKESSSGDTLGFTSYDASGNEVGNLQTKYRSFRTRQDTASKTKYLTTLGDYATDRDAYVGFRVRTTSGTNANLNFIAPHLTYTEMGTYYPYGHTNDTYYIPMVIKTGTGSSDLYYADNRGVIDISSEIPTTTSDLLNTAGFITSSALNGYATQTWVGNQGYITGITSGDVTTALGFTPYSSANPDGYITGINSSDVTTALGYTPTNPSSLATVATTGAYSDLIGTPTIPTTTSQLNNDSGFITNTVNNLTNYTLSSNLATVATSGSYNDLINKPNTPTQTVIYDCGDSTGVQTNVTWSTDVFANFDYIHIYYRSTDGAINTYVIPTDTRPVNDIPCGLSTTQVTTAGANYNKNDVWYLKSDGLGINHTARYNQIYTNTSGQVTLEHTEFIYLLKIVGYKNAGYFSAVAWNDITGKPTYYRHAITVYNNSSLSTATARAILVIINSSSTAFTLTTLNTWLSDNGYVGTANGVYSASGAYYSNSTSLPVMGIRTYEGRTELVVPKAAGAWDTPQIAGIIDNVNQV